MIWIFQWWWKIIRSLFVEQVCAVLLLLLVIASNSVVRFGIASLNNIKFSRTLNIKFQKCSLFTTDDILLLQIYKATVVVRSVSEYVVNHTVDELLIYSLILRVQIECVCVCVRFRIHSIWHATSPQIHIRLQSICIYKMV